MLCRGYIRPLYIEVCKEGEKYLLCKGFIRPLYIEICKEGEKYLLEIYAI
jgi:hypothetical protein